MKSVLTAPYYGGGAAEGACPLHIYQLIEDYSVS